MFPSNNNSNTDQDSFTDQSILHGPFFNDINPNSKNEDPPLSLFHFPSPFIHNELELQDHDVFLQQQYYDLLFQQQPLRADDSTASEIVVNMVDSRKSEVNGSTRCGNKRNPNLSNLQIPNKRPSKKDRHSKINTAKGPRDRRMRLSLDVARKFFNLQDMLGYDKASKTIEWLLLQAEVEIKKLERCLPEMNCSFSVGAKSSSSTSECEVVSGIDKATVGESISKSKPSSIKEKKIKQSRMTSFRPLTKDLREKARARARERASKKVWSRKFNESKLSGDVRNNDLNQLCSWTSFEAGEESGTQIHNRDHPLTVLAHEVVEPSSQDHQPKYLGNQEDVDDALVVMGKWSPSSVFNYLSHCNVNYVSSKVQSLWLKDIMRTLRAHHLLSCAWHVEIEGDCHDNMAWFAFS